MNIILYNITRFTIENGDTLEDPQISEGGKVLTFDRLRANPPFLQNSSRTNIKFPIRFHEWCPKTGKNMAERAWPDIGRRNLKCQLKLGSG